MIPSIVADGLEVGMALDVVARLDDWGALEVIASPEPGGRYYGASNGGLSRILENDAELLVWLADEVQEATMERDQVNVFVWPVCAIHQFGFRGLGTAPSTSVPSSCRELRDLADAACCQFREHRLRKASP